MNLLKSWVELMDDKKAITIEKIKTVITNMIHYAGDAPSTNYSAYISEKLQQNYNYRPPFFAK